MQPLAISGRRSHRGAASAHMHYAAIIRQIVRARTFPPRRHYDPEAGRYVQCCDFGERSMNHEIVLPTLQSASEVSVVLV